MKTFLFTLTVLVFSTGIARAQFGDLLNSIKSNPAVAQQKDTQNILSKAQSIAAIFAKMPLNNGKIDFVQAAMPYMQQALGASAQPNQTSQLSGLLDKVKGLAGQKWSTASITPEKTVESTNQIKQFNDTLGAIIKNQGGSLKNLFSTKK